MQVKIDKYLLSLYELENILFLMIWWKSLIVGYARLET